MVKHEDRIKLMKATKRQCELLSRYMMDATMKLFLFRTVGKRICSLSLLALICMGVTLFPQVDAYCMPLSVTRAIDTATTRQRFLRSAPDFSFLHQTKVEHRLLILKAEGKSSNDDSPKKKRRRKQPQASLNTSSAQVQSKSTVDEELNDTSVMNEIDLTMMNEIAKYEFQSKIDAPTLPTLPNIVDNDTISTFEPPQSTSTVSGAIPLPDIKEARKRKQMEEEEARIQQEQDEQKVRIKRTDKEAFRRVSCFHIQMYAPTLMGTRPVAYLKFSISQLCTSYWSNNLSPMPMNPTLKKSSMVL